MATEAHAAHPPVANKSSRVDSRLLGIYIFIASEVMFFVAWFWAYFEAALYTADPIQASRVEFTGGVWPPKGGPDQIAEATSVIALPQGVSPLS